MKYYLLSFLFVPLCHMTITCPELALADRRTKREIVAVENDLAKWEDMLGLAESGCELVIVTWKSKELRLFVRLIPPGYSPACI